MPANNSNSLNRHQISVIVGSVVGGVCGIILLVALAVLLYRKRQTIPSLSKRPKKDARHHDVDPPPGPIDFEPHRPKFTAYDSGSSLLKAANSSVEMHSLARGRQPYSSDSSPCGTPRSSNRPLEASEEGYRDEEIYVGQSVQLTREGTYNTLPNPYSIRNSQSYRSESSHTHSVDPNVTLYSSSNMHAHMDETQRLTKTPSESSAAIGTSDGYGYTFTPVHRMRRIANMDASDEDNLSVAELKRRQSQLFLLSVDGMAALPLVHTDSGLRMHSHPEAQAELPPVYSAE
ncbi:hypothetical protein BT96DRAFT_281513 [Gymnopus androsaceus JB14]|uniref:Uncharacterized protein n=1 Tax=Gymnopus androsaceus JB14 TaxID=1447944 RepID=A0A6A4I2S3_9AGAR|nr:hypothetical protein BT96DRAFT_281513 [Gymnopus androsaceus JB14]